MTALMDAYKLVKTNAVWANNVYVKQIPWADSSPAKLKEKSNQTFILVRDGIQELSLFSSNTFIEMNYGVQIQVFYSTDSTLDYDDVEIKLMKFLESKGWHIQSVRGRIQDPDTFQEFQTIIISKTKETI